MTSLNQSSSPEDRFSAWGADPLVQDLLELALELGAAQGATLQRGEAVIACAGSAFDVATASAPVASSHEELARLHLWGPDAVGRHLPSIAAQLAGRYEAAADREARVAATDFRRFFENEVDLHCVASLEGRFLSLNSSWSKVLGWSEDELKSRPFLDFVHPDDVAATLSEMGALGAGAKTLNFTNRYATADGSWRVFEWTAAAHVEEGVIYATARDVTDLRLAERHVARLSQALDRIVDLILLMDVENLRIQYANHGAVDATGYSREELVGATPYPLLQRFDSSSYDNLIAPLVGGEQEMVEFETFIRRKDGTRYRAAVVMQRVESPDAVELVLVARDLTYRTEVDRLKREFVSTVSHELRTPLTSIRGSLRLIEGGVVGPMPEEMGSLVSVAARNVERLVRLINDILDLEKIEGGQLELRRTAVDVRVLVQQTVESLHGAAGEVDVSVEVVEHTAPRPVLGDFDRLVQVLTNLLSNALKFSPPGGVVEVATRDVVTGIRFEVRDQGPGIAAEEQTRVFGKFQQVDQSDTRAKGGTGLGLAISKAIVEEHGGQIGVSSTPGHGAVFWFEIGCASVAPTAPARRRPPRRRSTMQPRSVVLIVEDDEDVVRVLGLMLRARGLGFVSAPTVASARQLLRDIRPDAVLLDLSLPDGDGLELLDDIEAEFAIPVVVITGSDRDVGTYGHPLLIDWVGKPFEEGRIEEALRLALTTRQDALVLVVEDDPSAREIIVQMLASIGVECLEASDGATAVEIVRDAQPDLVVLDVGLPALDGFSVVAELREGANHDTPLVVYSGRDLSAADREELTLGATRHLTKLRASETEFLDAVLELLGRALPGKA